MSIFNFGGPSILGPKFCWILSILFKKNIWPLSNSLDFHSRWIQTLAKRPNFWCQKCQKALPCRHFGGLHLWSLATSVKAQRLTSSFPPIELLNFLHLLTF